MIRILHMIGSLNIGGSQTMVMSLYHNIDREKIQFDFILDHPDQLYFADEVRSLGGRIYALPEFKGTNVYEIKSAWNTFFDEHKEYKVLHSHVRSYASIYIPIAKKHGVYTIIHSHSTSNGNGLSSFVKTVMQYPLRYQADYYMACSKKAGEWLYGKNINRRKNYQVIPNAIDAKRFDFNEELRNSIRSELNITDKFVVGHVGRMTEPKNHIFLVDVFSQIVKRKEDAMLLLVGDGDFRIDIEKKVSELKLNDKVIFLGNRGNTQDYYQAMDVFAIPSLWEGFPVVAIEAQASGLPCVVSERIPNEIDIKVGLVHMVPLETGAKKWAEEIVKTNIATRSSRINDLKAVGYDVDENAKKIQKFYLNIVAKMRR